jgi:putative aldouronate transport system permease protein
MRKRGNINRDQMTLALMVMPGMALLLVFRFFPIYGLQLAFKDLVPRLGIWGSPSVGLTHFKDFFSSPDFMQVMMNTVVISLMKILIGFPIPIIFALILNSLKSNRARNTIQGIVFMPHFLSWVVIAGMWIAMLGRESGVINALLLRIGLIQTPIHFMGEPGLFRWVLVGSEIWKDLGWNSIVYIAAMSAIDQSLYEAAEVDGVNRMQKALFITIPCILPTIIVMLIIRVGYILDAGFEQVLVFRNPMVYSVSNILDTYVYDTGLKYGRFGYATAVGLFKSVFAFLMVWMTNALAKKREMGIWQ